MKSLTDAFFALELGQRRVVHFALCDHALHKWNQYVNTQGKIRYIESIAATQQQVDTQLPADAIESAKQGSNCGNVEMRYREPIVAMQDVDLAFPENIKFAYYAIYNLFKKYALKEEIDDWLIVNQAIASEEDSKQQDSMLSNAIQEAT